MVRFYEAIDIKHRLILAHARMTAPEVEALKSAFGSIESAVTAGSTALERAGLRSATANRIADPDLAAIDRSLSWAEQPQHHLVVSGDAAYPELLSQIADAPLLLYIAGNPELLQLPALAIVGSRNPTRGGIHNAFEFARHLGSNGFCILSGLAEGIDTAAHEGALAGGGMTIAFLGHGLDRVYPSVNRDLAHRIAETGALVSEYPLGTPPRKEHFPERNRLISGCSMGTLVVEAARRSGSLITARLASEQGREVFAIPGSIHNALSRGCHQLIRNGAKLVECADDIVCELAPLAGHLMQNNDADEKSDLVSDDRDADYKLLIKTLAFDPATPDEIAEKCGLTIDQVSSMLLILELEGEVEALNGGQFALLKETLQA